MLPTRNGGPLSAKAASTEELSREVPGNGAG